MSFVPVRSGNAHADLYVARRRTNDAFLRDLIEDWKENGREILKRVAREQPGTYMKVMAMLMPKEMKVQTASTMISSLSDEQLQAMLHELQEQIAAKLNEAKVINGEAAELAALPAPQPTLYRRQPKSSPERLAYAREYMRKRRAAAKAARQQQADCTENDQSPPGPVKSR